MLAQSALKAAQAVGELEPKELYGRIDGIRADVEDASAKVIGNVRLVGLIAVLGIIAILILK